MEMNVRLMERGRERERDMKINGEEEEVERGQLLVEPRPTTQHWIGPLLLHIVFTAGHATHTLST
jgi:hypothetical protein